NRSKPDHVIDKIVEGRLNKFYEEAVLLDQPFVKEEKKTVGELITEKTAKTGEKVSIRRFTRYKMGEGIAKRGDDFESEDAKLATIMNAVVLQDALEKTGIHTRVLSAIDIPQLAESFIRRRAVRHLEKGRIVIFAAGTGNPFFSTDSAAALRALEIKADVILKGTKVDGIYSADPVTDALATRFETITFQEVLEKQLKVMDASAISLCMDNNLPIVVFNMRKPGNIARVVTNEGIGTRVCVEK